MRAKFIGQDGSLGLKHGEIYSLKYREQGFFRRWFLSRYTSRVIIVVRRAPFDFITIPYSRPLTFMANWHVLEV